MKIAIYKKGRGNPTNRKLCLIGEGKSKAEVINRNKRVGGFTKGEYVAFEVSNNKRDYKIDGIPVKSNGTPFKI
jgi:hypothetical protein